MLIKDLARIIHFSEDEIETAREIALKIASELNADATQVFAILSGLHVDGRTRPYRYRVQIFDKTGQVIADSHPDLETFIDGPAISQDVIYGLPAIVATAASMCAQYHSIKEQQILPIFNAKMQTLRNNLSRNSGIRASWRVAYAAGEETYLCRVDVTPTQNVNHAATAVLPLCRNMTTRPVGNSA